jgi:hypothetical protein
MESSFCGVEWRLWRVSVNQWKIRKAMIRMGMGTPRSQKSPYFIRFTPVTNLFAAAYVG